MKRSIRRWFHGLEFIQSATSSIINNPFWFEANDGSVEPYPRDSEENGKKLQIYYSKTLPSLGFYSLVDGDDYTHIHLVDGIAVEVDQDYIRDYIKFVLSKIDIGDSIIDVMTQRYEWFFSKRILTSLRSLFTLKPLKDTRTTAYRFYNNGIIKINNKEGIDLIPYGSQPDDTFVWANKIIDRLFDPNLCKSFDKEDFISDITNKAGHHFHKWCQNLCKDQDETGKWVYNQNRFKTLSTGFGYLLHQKWNEYKCVVFVDSDLEDGKANGRTGKSLVLNDALSYALDSVSVEADSLKRDRSNKFLFHNVSRSSQYICLDDACKDFDFSTLFSKISGPFTCEKKYGGIFQFPKNEKPKIGLSTNHPIIGEGSSYVDRQHIVEVGGYYRFHKMELNKDPHQFHDGWLFDDDWSSSNWMEFDAFCAYSLLYYLQEGLLGGKSSNNYGYRKLVASVGSTSIVNSIQRFLEENAGKETYGKFVEGMDDDLKGLCLYEYVETHSPEEHISQKALTTALKSVAEHFRYGINRGSTNPRPQKRFGKGLKNGVNLYRITSPSKPFGSVSECVNEDDSSSDEISDEEWAHRRFEDLDPQKKYEKSMGIKTEETIPQLNPKPVLPSTSGV